MDVALRCFGAVVTEPTFLDVAADRRVGMARAAGRVAVQRYLIGNDGADLDRAVAMYRLAADGYPAGHPDRPSCVSALGNALCIRFEFGGQPHDLDDGIACARDSLTGVPESERWLALHNLAANLGMRYELLGHPADLQEALAAMRGALAADPAPAEAPQLLNTACNLFIHRFERDGALDDLEAAAELAVQGLSAQGLSAAKWAGDRGVLRATTASCASTWTAR